MEEKALTLRPVGDDEERLSYVRRLLDRNDLPTSDVASKPGCFFVGYAGEDAGDDADEGGIVADVSDADEVGVVAGDSDADEVGVVAGECDADRVGAGGVEVRGADGLLRSIVVERSVRGEGYGAGLCAALEERAAAEGVDTLYLLTTTAADFFAARGYVEIERAAAPVAIRETSEFRELCPDAATCMRKSLEDAA